jgi:hypothetical protein
MNYTYCGTWADRSHVDCASSVECTAATLEEIDARQAAESAPVALPVGTSVTDEDLGAGTVVRSSWPLVSVAFVGIDSPVWVTRRSLTVTKLPNDPAASLIRVMRREAQARFDSTGLPRGLRTFDVKAGA